MALKLSFHQLEQKKEEKQWEKELLPLKPQQGVLPLVSQPKPQVEAHYAVQSFLPTVYRSVVV